MATPASLLNDLLHYKDLVILYRQCMRRIVDLYPDVRILIEREYAGILGDVGRGGGRGGMGGLPWIGGKGRGKDRERDRSRDERSKGESSKGRHGRSRAESSMKENSVSVSFVGTEGENYPKYLDDSIVSTKHQEVLLPIKNPDPQPPKNLASQDPTPPKIPLPRDLQPSKNQSPQEPQILKNLNPPDSQPQKNPSPQDLIPPKTPSPPDPQPPKTPTPPPPPQPQQPPADPQPPTLVDLLLNLKTEQPLPTITHEDYTTLCKKIPASTLSTITNPAIPSPLSSLFVSPNPSSKCVYLSSPSTLTSFTAPNIFTPVSLPPSLPPVHTFIPLQNHLCVFPLAGSVCIYTGSTLIHTAKYPQNQWQRDTRVNGLGNRVYYIEDDSYKLIVIDIGIEGISESIVNTSSDREWVKLFDINTDDKIFYINNKGMIREAGSTLPPLDLNTLFPTDKIKDWKDIICLSNTLWLCVGYCKRVNNRTPGKNVLCMGSGNKIVGIESIRLGEREGEGRPIDRVVKVDSGYSNFCYVVAADAESVHVLTAWFDAPNKSLQPQTTISLPTGQCTGLSPLPWSPLSILLGGYAGKEPNRLDLLEIGGEQ